MASGIFHFFVPVHSLSHLCWGWGTSTTCRTGRVHWSLSTFSTSISFLQDREEALDHPVPGGGVIAQVSEDTVQPGGVKLSIVDKEQYQQAGQTLVVQEHPSSELDIVSSSQSCSILLVTWATPSYTSPQVGPARPPRPCVYSVLITKPVHCVPQYGGECGPSLVDVVEKPLVHHLSVPLFIIPP